MPKSESIQTLTPYRLKRAKQALRQDENISRLIDAVGPFRLKPDAEATVFASLARSIVSQLLSTAAARTIHGRLLDLLEQQPTPENMLALEAQALRDVGLSWAKVAAMHDLANKCLDGTVPDRTAAEQYSDRELIKRITQVKGIGQWTVEMLLIFTLGRIDVWPVDDLGVRRGWQLAHQLDEMPNAKELRDLGEPWRGHRTVLSWYCWRANEVAWDRV